MAIDGEDRVLAQVEQQARTIGQLRAQLRKLGVLYNVTRILTRTRDAKEALESILDEVMTTTGATSGSISTVDADGGLIVRSSRGFGRNSIDGFALSPGQGITGWVAAHRRSLLVPDVRDDDHYVQLDRRIHSELAVPILAGERLLGVLNLDHTRLEAFDRSDLEMMEAVASQAAAVLEVADLFAAVDARTRELERMQEIGKSLVETLDEEELFQRIADVARELLDAKVSGLYLVHPGDRMLTLEASSGQHWRPQDLAIEVATSRVGQAVRDRAVVRVPDVREDPVFLARDDARERGLVSLLAVPILDRDQPLGVLAVFFGELHDFREAEEQLLAALAAQVAVAIRNVRQLEERVRLEEERGQNERLVLLGALAAEVAHEIRNPLSVMNLLTHSLRRDLDPEDPKAEDLRVLKDNIAQLERLTGRILGLARSRPGAPELEDLGIVVQTVLRLIRPRLERAGIERSVRIPDKLSPVRMVRAEIEQVLLNLVLNAVQAMPEGGQLGVRTYERLLAGGKRVLCVAISDSGSGIDPAIRERILEPFFTTRPRGTGLGLSVVDRILSEHGGRLRIRSSPGCGSTFTMELPGGS